MAHKRDLWTYLDKWKKIFHAKRKICWNGKGLENDYCKDCKFCCGPQGDDEPFPMALLPYQLGPENQQDFYMLNKNTAYLGADGCKSITPTGCRLPQEKRPIACGLFPLVLANGQLYLYLFCPAAFLIPLKEFIPIAKEAEKMLKSFSRQELEHISLNLTDEVLAQKYINLGIKIF